MKLNQIEWKQGNKYLITGNLLKNSREVIVDNEVLKLTDGTGREVTEIIAIGYLVKNAEFKKIIEPVNYMEAYEDCKTNSGNDKLIVYANELTPSVRMNGINNVVSLHLNKLYGNIDRVNENWIKQTR